MEGKELCHFHSMQLPAAALKAPRMGLDGDVVSRRGNRCSALSCRHYHLGDVGRKIDDPKKSMVATDVKKLVACFT